MSTSLPNLGDRAQARRSSGKGAFDVQVLINEIGGIAFQRNGEFFSRSYRLMNAPGEEEAFKRAHAEGKLAQFMADKAAQAAEPIVAQPALVSEANRRAAPSVDEYLRKSFVHMVHAYEHLGAKTQEKYPDDANKAWDHISRELVGNFRVLVDYVLLDQLEVARKSLGPSKSPELDFEVASSFRSGNLAELANALLNGQSARLKAEQGDIRPAVR